jgi:hypothetical protein
MELPARGLAPRVAQVFHSGRGLKEGGSVTVINAAAEQHPAQLESTRPSTPVAATLSAERGRELARLQVLEMIRKIQIRARAERLNRGLTVSLPFFDDAGQELRWRELVMIPRGRIPFVPAFVVVAARQEAARVQREPGLSDATRAHLIGLLEMLAQAFEADPSCDGVPSGERS